VWPLGRFEDRAFISQLMWLKLAQTCHTRHWILEAHFVLNLMELTFVPSLGLEILSSLVRLVRYCILLQDLLNYVQNIIRLVHCYFSQNLCTENFMMMMMMMRMMMRMMMMMMVLNNNSTKLNAET